VARDAARLARRDLNLERNRHREERSDAAIQESQGHPQFPWIVGVDGPERHLCAMMRFVEDFIKEEPSVDQITRVGMDTSKRFFQLHGVDAEDRPALRGQ
jgi:hypothetical protein